MVQEKSEEVRQLHNPSKWVDDHGDLLFRYAVARVRDHAIAEDLVQETFLAAIRNRMDFAGKSAERTWFVGILKHKIIDHLRRQSRECSMTTINSSLGDELFDQKGWWQARPAKWPEDPKETLHQQEFWTTFWTCYEHLPRRLRAVFSLREMDEMRTEEVCEALNISSGNLGVLLYRARMGLRRCLEINWFRNETEED